MAIERISKRIEWSVMLTSGRELTIAYEPETYETAACLEIPQSHLSATEIDGMIQLLNAIGEEIRRIEKDVAGPKTGSHGLTLA